MAASQTSLRRVDEEYPRRLDDLKDPPTLLRVWGEVPSGEAVAIVGSRAADRQGLRVARELSSQLAAVGVTVVSGGARGVDQAAHLGALEGGGGTVMVLGCGLDVEYPRGSTELRRRVAESGAVVSELPDDAKPRPGHFPRRNRIVAALAQATVVVQAGERSGALVTARLARGLGRPVLAVPGQPAAALTRGTHSLLKSGALLVDDVDDILRAIGREPERTGAEAQAPWHAHLSGFQAAVARFLDAGPASVDEMARGLERPVGEVMATLVELEMDGLVASRGGCFERA